MIYQVTGGKGNGARQRGGGRSPLRGQGGQSTVEFALVLPFLLVFFMLLAQAAMVLRAQIIVTGAAREGARKAVETGNQAMIAGAALRAAAGLDPQRMQIEIDCPQRKRGQPVTVRVSYRVPLYLPALGNLFPSEITVRGSATMRVENDREGE
jgi:hypothetical protein